MRPFSLPAYTLVELLVALALSLLLLLGVAELFRHVGGTMSETRAIMHTSARLNETALLLRQDLERIPTSLAKKPEDIIRAKAEGREISDRYGYLTIIEGPDACQSNTTQPPRYVNWDILDEDGNPTLDRTVGDVDDIVAFTAIALPDMPFRGVIGGRIAERNAAEIIWFVRGNTLYRRMRLIDDERANKNFNNVGDFTSRAFLPPANKGDYAIVLNDESIDGGRQRYDAVEDGDGWRWIDLLTLEDLARRARRFGNDGLGTGNTHQNNYPHSLYAGANAGWYYLRMPTFEETDFWSANNIRYWKTRNVLPEPTEPNPDLWNQPLFFPNLLDSQSGSLNTAIESPRNLRAGEDVVLTNVLSFDVKVWCPEANLFVDLGTEGSSWEPNSRAAELHGYVNKEERWGHVWDSWTQQYQDNPDPPYAQRVEAVQIVIRNFDPASRIIRQVTVVHRF
ncbi:MAG: hypothetical protein FWG73_03330 [Planctomycetaceae bacterium]|nr:hypothetical protein [Planctomycetaceae bacterium]